MQDSQYKLVSRGSSFGGPEEWDQERGLFYRRDFDNSPFFGRPPFFGNSSSEPRTPEPRFRSPSGPSNSGFPFPFQPPWAQPQYEPQQQPQPQQVPQSRQRTGERTVPVERPQQQPRSNNGQRTQPDYLGPNSRR